MKPISMPFTEDDEFVDRVKTTCAIAPMLAPVRLAVAPDALERLQQLKREVGLCGVSLTQFGVPQIFGMDVDINPELGSMEVQVEVFHA